MSECRVLTHSGPSLTILPLFIAGVLEVALLLGIGYAMDLNALPPEHFLSLPRPDVFLGPPTGVPDTTTLAAHDFDVDTRTGFMPPEEPIKRLPSGWEEWEVILDKAMQAKLQLGDKIGLSEDEAVQSDSWRHLVHKASVTQ
jgi:indoleamine 2,3-dioxygenase